MHKLLFRHNGVNLQNMIRVSATIMLFSLLITWTIEFLANEVLLHY